jgi:hypothetical protein
LQRWRRSKTSILFRKKLNQPELKESMEEKYQKLCNYEFVVCAAFALWTDALERKERS